MYPPKTDAFRMAQRGDAAAFEHLYRLHSRRVYAICLRALGSNREAEELTQEAFLQSFRNIGNVQDESAFSTALLRLTIRLALKSRAARRTPAMSEDLILDLVG